MDMTQSIAPKSDQMNAEDLISGPRTFTITDVRQGSSEQPVFVYVAEHPQPFKPSKTVRRLMVVAWGSDSAAYIGKRMTLYRDPDVRFAGENVGGIRVSHMSGIGHRKLSIALAVTKGRRTLYEVEPLPDVERLVPSLANRAQSAVDAWASEGVTLAQLERRTGVLQASWTDEVLVSLQGLWRALAAGETTVADAFPTEREIDE
jgi:hypothetical protein